MPQLSGILYPPPEPMRKPLLHHPSKNVPFRFLLLPLPLLENANPHHFVHLLASLVAVLYESKYEFLLYEVRFENVLTIPQRSLLCENLIALRIDAPQKLGLRIRCPTKPYRRSVGCQYTTRDAYSDDSD